MKRSANAVIWVVAAMRLAVATLACALVAPQASATGPGTVAFPNTLQYGVTFGAGGEYHSTTALVDINNPSNGATISGGNLDVSVQNTPSVTISGTPSVSGNGTFTVGQATGTNLHVVCDSGCSSSTAPADESAFTPGTTSQTPIGGFFQTTATSNPLTTGEMGAFQVTANRALFTNLRNSSGTELATSGAPLRIDPTGTTTQPVSLASLPALAAGSNTIGAVTQASGPWTVNQTEVNGSAVATAATGIQKVGLTDGSGNAINSTSNALNVDLTAASATVNTGTHTLTDINFDPGTNGFTTAPFSVLTTELNSLASAGVATSSVNGTSGVFSQTTTGNDPFGRCWVDLGGALGGTAVAGANFSIWFLTSIDGGTTFESQTVSPPPRAPDVIIPVGASAYASAAILMSPPRTPLWAESVKIVLQNNTGQALAASGNIVKCAGESYRQ